MKYVIIGGGGHSKVLIDLLRSLSLEIECIYDPDPKIGSEVMGVSVRRDDTEIEKMDSKTIDP